MTQTALAQSRDALIVQPPDSSQFPEISVLFKLPFSHSSDISEINLSHLVLYENGDKITPDSLNKKRSGIHFALAINPGPPLDLYDSSGVSSFDKLRETLLSWADARSTVLGDTWSFIGGDLILTANSRDRELWIDALEAYQPNFRTLQPQLSSLEEAIALSEERIVPFGVDKTIVYITPAPLPDQIDRIKALSQRASSKGIQVNVWMIDEAYFLTNDQGGVLLDLANTTGGSFFNFTGSEVVPNPELYFTNLGTYYELLYQSSVRETGTNSLQIELKTEDVQAVGESAPFYLDVKPPNPILISPPATIKRVQASEEAEELLPSNQRIAFMVEFPDFHHRTITTCRLFVDGIVIDERSGHFENVLDWDLTSIKNSGAHTIQVEVEDSLGLSAKTILTPVFVEVAVPEVESKLDPGQIGLVALAILFIVSLAMFISWLVRRYWQSERFMAFLPARFIHDSEDGSFASTAKYDQNKVIAKLIPIMGHEENTEKLLQIKHSHVKIGSDPTMAEIAINHPSIDHIQSMIDHNEGGFWIGDLGSTTGTWVNYSRIGRQPVRIQTGDILHFGIAGYRFSIVDDENKDRVTFSSYEPPL